MFFDSCLYVPHVRCSTSPRPTGGSFPVCAHLPLIQWGPWWWGLWNCPLGRCQSQCSCTGEWFPQSDWERVDGWFCYHQRIDKKGNFMEVKYEYLVSDWLSAISISTGDILVWTPALFLKYLSSSSLQVSVSSPWSLHKIFSSAVSSDELSSPSLSLSPLDTTLHLQSLPLLVSSYCCI